jgi:DNA-binding MarR family transcriptional regulator
MQKHKNNIPEELFISYELSHKFKLTFKTSVLYSIIKYWVINEEGYCCADNKEFANHIDVSTRQIQNMISNLIKKGLIRREVENNNYRKLYIVDNNL